MKLTERASEATPATTAVRETHLSLPGRRQGKVRDIYQLPSDGTQTRGSGGGRDVGGGAVLIVATDRISAYDVVLPTPLPGKGKLLTEISVQWFNFIRKLNIIGDHLISTDPSAIPDLSDAECKQLDGRIMIGRACRVIPIECVARGYITGSGWKEYLDTGSVCGIKLPSNLQQCDQLPQPIFTPATKEDVGHDENIDFERACSVAGRDVMERLRDITLTIYTKAAAYALERGIIIADTKFEFGWVLDAKGNPTDEIILIDEVLTPDSSRFWPADDYQPGRDQDSFDKQYVRNYLQGLVKQGKWNKTAPGPELPEEIVRNTIARYREARELLFG
ncbi:MAG: phosphoribosylaminoimidazolesuccinocarboxamide synthase [Phycisphaerales bacterium]